MNITNDCFIREYYLPSLLLLIIIYATLSIDVHCYHYINCCNMIVNAMIKDVKFLIDISPDVC